MSRRSGGGVGSSRNSIECKHVRVCLFAGVTTAAGTDRVCRSGDKPPSLSATRNDSGRGGPGLFGDPLASPGNDFRAFRKSRTFHFPPGPQTRTTCCRGSRRGGNNDASSLEKKKKEREKKNSPIYNTVVLSSLEGTTEKKEKTR